MAKQKNTQLLIIAFLTITIFVMSIGFAAAAYNQALNINSSNVTVKASKWDIHFKDSSYTETAGSIAANSHTLNATSMTYDVTLLKPGDYYEFTVDVENLGTFDANLVSITMGGLTTDQEKYVKYTLTYEGTEYTATDLAISGVTLDNTTGVHSVKVRVEYIQPDSDADLPSTDQTVNLTATLNYQQAS